MSELATALLVLNVILSLLTALFFFVGCVILYFIWRRIKAVEDTQDVIFNSCANTEAYFQMISEQENITAGQN